MLDSSLLPLTANNRDCWQPWEASGNHLDSIGRIGPQEVKTNPHNLRRTIANLGRIILGSTQLALGPSYESLGMAVVQTYSEAPGIVMANIVIAIFMYSFVVLANSESED